MWKRLSAPKKPVPKAPIDRSLTLTALLQSCDREGAGCKAPHQMPIAFHHKKPTVDQIAMFTSEIRNPMRHQSFIET